MEGNDFETQVRSFVMSWHIDVTSFYIAIGMWSGVECIAVEAAAERGGCCSGHLFRISFGNETHGSRPVLVVFFLLFFSLYYKDHLIPSYFK